MYRLFDFAVPLYHKVDIKVIEKREKYLDLAREIKKVMEHKRETSASYGFAWNGAQSLEKKTGRIGNQRRNRIHPDYSLFEISHNTKKSSRDLKRLSVTQTLVKDY